MTETTRPRTARTGLAIYLAVVILVSGVLEWRLFQTGDDISQHPGLIFGLMWTPALASLIARLVLREGIRDVSFRWPADARRMLLVSWLYPLGVGAVAYGIAWSTGLATFSVPALPTVSDLSPALGFARTVITRLTIVTVVGMAFSAGEEIGWRGYMLTRLIDARIPRPVLVGGLIWALWHVPLVLSGQYASSSTPALSALLFVIDIVAGSYLFAWLRLSSGSLWPPILAHASWNAVIQNVFDAYTRGTSMWVGESGILVALIEVIVAIVLTRRAWADRRYPPARS